MKIETKNILNNWKEYTLENSHGMQVRFLNYGGIITEMNVPNRKQEIENVVLRYKDYADYKENPNYFGAIIGPVAGRIENSSFICANKTIRLEKNNGEHHLHGGTHGFHQVIWKTTPFEKTNRVGVKLTHTSLAAIDGYPGDLKVTVTYTLTNDNQFIIDYKATTSEDTALTLTNHAYFNLSGNLARTVHAHHVTMAAHEFIELDSSLIPTGRKLDVTNSPFDFREGRKLVDGIQSNARQNKIANHGYDHYFLLNEKATNSILVKEETSGRTMTITTNQPGVVIYTGNALDDSLNLFEGPSKPHMGVCFETQAPPASLHHKDFPSILLNANEVYDKQTIFAFHND